MGSSMNQDTKASIDFIIPIYRSAPHVYETLQSLLAQEDSHEVYIKMRTTAADDFLQEHHFPDSVEVTSFSKGEGIGSDWNAALALAKSPIAVLAHSDDVYESTYSKAVRAAFLKYPQAGIAFTRTSYFDSHLKRRLLLLIKDCLTPNRRSREAVLIEPLKIARALRWGNFISCPTVAFHLPVIQNHLGAEQIFDPKLQNVVDWDAWMRMAQKKIPFIFIPEPLVKLRIHPEATTQSLIRTGSRVQEEKVLMERFWGKSLGRIISRFFNLGKALQKIE